MNEPEITIEGKYLTLFPNSTHQIYMRIKDIGYLNFYGDDQSFIEYQGRKAEIIKVQGNPRTGKGKITVKILDFIPNIPKEEYINYEVL
jgi:hypothetical protein